jgi:hypothetical protein
MLMLCYAAAYALLDYVPVQEEQSYGRGFAVRGIVRRDTSVEANGERDVKRLGRWDYRARWIGWDIPYEPLDHLMTRAGGRH